MVARHREGFFTCKSCLRLASPCCAQNPFGAAKPREAILASRSGKTEDEILREELAKEKLKVRALALACMTSAAA